MAIDTRDKRSGAVMVALPWRGLLPLADGVIGQADRQMAATMYPGILAGALVAQVGPFTLTIADVAAYGLTLTDRAAHTVMLSDTSVYTLTVSDD